MLTLCHSVPACAHAWVTDASILEAIEHFHFDDPAVPHTEATHRARRIASIVVMMEAGVEFHPLKLKPRDGTLYLSDGHHRLRAYQYRRALGSIPVSLPAEAVYVHPACVCPTSVQQDFKRRTNDVPSLL